jgi:hypothetical protein
MAGDPVEGGGVSVGTEERLKSKLVSEGGAGLGWGTQEGRGRLVNEDDTFNDVYILLIIS